MYNMLALELIDDIVDNYKSFKPSIYNKIDDRLCYNSKCFKVTDNILILDVDEQ